MKTQKKYRVLGPVAHQYTAANTGSWRLERPVVDFSQCIKCGTCARFCPPGIITIDKDQEECVIFDWYFCKGCGICANECPKKCIMMEPEGGEADA